MYCSQCRSKLIKACKFCTKWGAKIRTVVQEKSTENNSSATTKSFNDYFDHKSNKRTRFFKCKEWKRTRDENPTSKKSTSKFSFLARETVTINIGLMESTDKNDYNLGPIRGSRLPVKVQKSFAAAEVLSAGILKHSNHDQFFYSSEDYLLLFPDRKVVTSIPGSEELFTVEKYKKKLVKSFSKLDLYLCRTSEFVGNSGPLSTLNRTESTISASPAIANNTPYMHEGEPKETSLLELDAYLNQNDIINVSENVPLNTQPLQHFPGFWGENSSLVSGDQMLDSVPGPSGHNSVDRKNYWKVFCPICNRKFPVSVINEHADACLDKQTTPTKICITSEDEGKNLEENDLQIINHNGLSRNDIAAIISSAVNNDCRVVNDFSVKLNIRRDFYFEDFVKAFNK